MKILNLMSKDKIKEIIEGSKDNKSDHLGEKTDDDIVESKANEDKADSKKESLGITNPIYWIVALIIVLVWKWEEIQTYL